MTLIHIRCAGCSYKDVKAQRTYTIKQGEQRTIYACDSCGDLRFHPQKIRP